MPGKKAHQPRDPGKAGTHNVQQPPGRARKSSGQTEGQFGRDPKGRKGQFSGSGDAALNKK
jgi:hypothetical protein